MNYEIESILNPEGNLWICSFKTWEKGACRCKAVSNVIEINSDIKPGIEEIKKALLN